MVADSQVSSVRCLKMCKALYRNFHELKQIAQVLTSIDIRPSRAVMGMPHERFCVPHSTNWGPNGTVLARCFSKASPGQCSIACGAPSRIMSNCRFRFNLQFIVTAGSKAWCNPKQSDLFRLFFNSSLCSSCKWL